MSSPGLQTGKLSTTMLEPPKTPVSWSSCKSETSGSSPFPGSVRVRTLGSTPITSTPVAPCKSTQQADLIMNNHSLTHTTGDECTPGTPANSDATINYALSGHNKLNPLVTHTSQILSETHVPKSAQVHKASLSESGSSIIGATNKSSIGQSHLQAVVKEFLHPGGHMFRKDYLSLDEASSFVQTKAVTQESLEDVICIEESPPNSQPVIGSKEDQADTLSTGSPSTIHNKTQQATEHEKPRSQNMLISDEGTKKLSSASPDTISERTGSPVLFETPGSVGGVQSLSSKLSKKLHSDNPPTSHCSNPEVDFDEDKTPPISPTENKAVKDARTAHEQEETGELNSQCDVTDNQQKDKEIMSSGLSCVKPNTGNISCLTSEKSATGSKKQRKGRNTVLGQPRTRRQNTRMAKRKSLAEKSACGSITKFIQNTPNKESTVTDDDDFVPDKRTPRKAVKVEPTESLVHKLYAIVSFTSCSNLPIM